MELNLNYSAISPPGSAKWRISGVLMQTLRHQNRPQPLKRNDDDHVPNFFLDG
jgi:hypothetical protein